MINALKKLDRKFLIIAISLLVLPILLIIFLAIIQGCSNRKMNYDAYEKKMISAANVYFKNKDMIPTKEAQTAKVTLDELVKNTSLKDPAKALKDDTCTGSVTVRRNGNSVEKNAEGFLNYTVDLKCKDYSTVHLVDKLKENVVTSDSGLYQIDNTYIFKGDNPKNYITFFGVNYRIMSIDSNGVLKLVKEDSEDIDRIWDNKYNVDVEHYYGKNIYKDSQILKYLLNDYNNSKVISKKAREHIVAYNVCIGKRSSNDYSINKSTDCSEVLQGQVISLINVSDYASASLDQDCNSTNSRACNNYNYLYRVAQSTWTLNSVSDNTYGVIYLSNGMMRTTNANDYNDYNIVIYVDGNELYTEGIGSSENPYIIK